MSLLNYNSSEPKRSGEKKTPSIILGIGLIVGTIALGSTLAASINLNGGGPVEFGQGVAQTVACDDEVVVTPLSTFVNDDADGGFKFTAISLSELDGSLYEDSSDKGCAGKTFTIKTYNSGGALLTPTYSISLDSNGDFSSPDGNTEGNSEGLSNSSVKLLFMGTLINAESVYRITIESSDSIATEPTEYSIGETGPGGGIVFYYSEEPFTSTGSNCGSDCHYLEVTPSNWSEHNAENYYKYSDFQLASQSETPGNQSGLMWERASWRIGAGMSNTLLIAAENSSSTATNIASKVALEYVGADNLVGEWFVPSMNELNELCKFANSLPTGTPTTHCSQNELLPGFTTNWYWSSSEWNEPTDDRKDEFKMWMNFGGTYSMDMFYQLMNLRPIRAF